MHMVLLVQLGIVHGCFLGFAAGSAFSAGLYFGGVGFGVFYFVGFGVHLHKLGFSVALPYHHAGRVAIAPFIFGKLFFAVIAHPYIFPTVSWCTYSGVGSRAAHRFVGVFPLVGMYRCCAGGAGCALVACLFSGCHYFVVVRFPGTYFFVCERRGGSSGQLGVLSAFACSTVYRVAGCTAYFFPCQLDGGRGGSLSRYLRCGQSCGCCNGSAVFAVLGSVGS